MPLRQNQLYEEQEVGSLSQLSSAVLFFVKNVGSTFTIQRGILFFEAVSVQEADNNTICIKFNSNFDNITIIIDHEGQFLNAMNVVLCENHPVFAGLDSDFAKLLVLQLFKRLEHSSPDSNSNNSIGNVQKSLLTRILKKLLE